MRATAAKEETMSYTYPYGYEEKEVQRAKLPTDRAMWKLMILSILTLGIYRIVFFIPFSFDLRKISPHDYSKQMNYMWAHFLGLFTLTVVVDIWHYQTARSVSEALEYRRIDYEFGTGDFWKWFLLGSLILVGPFIYFHKLCKAMNLLCRHYNENPGNVKN